MARSSRTVATPEWFDMLRQKMSDEGLETYQDLATYLGLERVEITRLFQGTVYTRVANLTVEKLGMPPPAVPVRHRDDPVILELMGRLRRLNPDRYSNFIQRLRALVAGEEAERDL